MLQHVSGLVSIPETFCVSNIHQTTVNAENNIRKNDLKVLRNALKYEVLHSEKETRYWIHQPCYHKNLFYFVALN